MAKGKQLTSMAKIRAGLGNDKVKMNINSISFYQYLLFIICVLYLSFNNTANAQTEWRSQLYQENWQPYQPDSAGRFLHDFSYAGYHMGEDSIPVISNSDQSRIINVTNPPYNADNTGKTNVTGILQKAIDKAQRNGGIVYLPAGTYRIKPEPGKSFALLIQNSNIIVKGDGPDKTFLMVDDPVMRNKSGILISPAQIIPNIDDFILFPWIANGDRIMIAEDVPVGAKQVRLSHTAGLNVGDWIVLGMKVTDEWVREHYMGLNQHPQVVRPWDERIHGPTFYRQILQVDHQVNSITVDIPIRYPLQKRDSANIWKTISHLQEIGLQDFSIGMKEAKTYKIKENSAYNEQGTGAYDAHNSSAVRMIHTINGWIKNVHSYQPAFNQQYHLPSNFITIEACRNVNIESCETSNLQYKGAGSNGYGFRLRGSDCLMKDCSASKTRHGASIQHSWATGNVIYNSSFFDNGHSVDYHKYLSVGNLMDNVGVHQDFLQAYFRPWGGQSDGLPQHGFSATQCVFWNARGSGKDGLIVYSEQFGWGYVIGTPAGTKVQLGKTPGSAPIDWLEGEGKGDQLIPVSLYLDQLKRRLLKYTKKGDL